MGGGTDPDLVPAGLAGRGRPGLTLVLPWEVAAGELRGAPNVAALDLGVGRGGLGSDGVDVGARDLCCSASVTERCAGVGRKGIAISATKVDSLGGLD